MMQNILERIFRYPDGSTRKRGHSKDGLNVMFTIGEDGKYWQCRMRGPEGLLEVEVARIYSLLPPK